jgi:DNA-binding SARP family transcriptional activator
MIHLQLARALRVDGVPGGARALAGTDAAMLAWLALEGPTPRNRLAALLWPDKPPEAARNSLRQRLFQLRRQFGADLVEGSINVALVEDVTHDLHDADTLLDGVVLEIGGEFAQWLALQRERRGARVRRSLAELADMAETAKDWDDALGHARELLALEPLSEAAHRRVIRLHYLAGDRAAALLAFDRCEQVLKDEVGAQPSAETMALLAAVSATGGAAPLPVQATVPASVLRPPRLVGREREFAALDAAWLAGHVAGLVGEAGLGKTRLLHEFAATRPDVVVASGRPGDAGVPFATLARLLRAVAAAGAVALPAATRGEIARVLPEFEPGGPAPRGEGQRLVLLRAVQSLLEARPPHSTLSVDDLHFADAASLDLLAGLIDGEDTGEVAPPLRWLLAWRPAEAGSPLHALLDRLTESARLLPIALTPLDEAALAELVDSLGLPGLPEGGGRALAAGLQQRTGGNPLFVLETLKQAWVERTLAQLADVRKLPRPPSVGRLIERRLAQLSPSALALARVASIAGVDFSLELAESVLQAGVMQFADAINELEAAQVLRGTQFAHDLVFDAVRAGVPRTVAQLTHARVAAWLEPRGSEPARVAQHWIDAAQPQRALPWLQKAADAARRALRPRESVAFMERISEIEEEAGNRAAAFDALLTAAEALVNIDRDGATPQVHCERLDRLAVTPVQRVQALWQRGHMLQQLGQVDGSVATLQEALQQCLPLGDAALIARVRRQLSIVYSNADRGAEALEQLLACMAWFEQHAGDAERAEMLGEAAMLYDNLGRLDGALPYHRMCLDLLLRGTDYGNLSVGYGNLAVNRIDAGALAEADLALRHAERAQAAADIASTTGATQVLRALALCHLGRYGRALAQAEGGVESMRRQQPGYLDRAELRLAQCWWHLGQWARVAAILSARQPDAQSSLSVRVTHGRLAWAYALGGGAGRHTAAVVARERLVALCEEFFASDARGRPDLALPLRIELADAGDANAALAQIDAARVQAQRIGHLGTVQAAHIRAAAVAAAHDPARARREALAALALAERGIGNTVLLPAELWLHAGRALLAAADPQAAQVLKQGRDWVHRTAQNEVPEPFRDGFLTRNPVNRDLLALAARPAWS